MPTKQSGFSALVVIFILLGITILGSGLYILGLTNGLKKLEDTTQPTPNSSLSPQSSPGASTSSYINPRGQSSKINANTSDPKGPWNNDLHYAISNDGNTFRDDKIWEERSGVVSVIHDKTGRLIGAFQWFPVSDDQNFDKVAIKISNDGGETWSKPTPAKFVNYPADMQRPFDPTLVLTPEGKIRMYYTSTEGQVKMPDTDSSRYYSAISDDGINYIFEPGIRYGLKDNGLVDSAVVYFNNQYLMLSPENELFSGAFQASSSNGLSFQSGADIKKGDQYNWTGNLLNFRQAGVDGVRFYGTAGKGGGKMFYSFSSDGKTWESPEDTNLEGGDPAVVQALENKYLIFYASPSKNSPMVKQKPQH